MNNDYQTSFSAEEIDEQIDFATQRLRSKPASAMPIPDLRLIEDMQRAYPADAEEMARGLERVRRRLAHSAPEVGEGQPRPRRGRASRPDALYASGAIPPGGRQGRGIPARLVALAAAVLLVVVIGGLVAGIILVRQHGPVVSNQPTAKPGQTAQPTQPPTPAEIAYIGSDNNIWVMTWPGGTPKQLTTDGVPTNRYSWVTWSPDGSLLAAVKTTVSDGIGTIVIMKPDGSVVASSSSIKGWYHTPPVWSPDGTMLAYRGYPDIPYLPSGDNAGALFILDPHTLNIEKTITYDLGTSQCGASAYSPLSLIIGEVGHDNYSGYLDTFVWVPDQRSMLVSYGCGGQVAQVDLSTGATTLPYPLYGSYQPGGNLILGYWHDGTLGLTDPSANHVRALVKAEPYVDPPKYVIRLGVATWTNDGQTIYYEHDDSIWRIGVDGSHSRQVVAGAALDSQQNATLQLVPSPSPDGQMLLYFQVTGSNQNIPQDPSTGPTPPAPTTQWYIAQADGSNPQSLPQSISDVVWRPGK